MTVLSKSLKSLRERAIMEEARERKLVDSGATPDCAARGCSGVWGLLVPGSARSCVPPEKG